MFFIIAATVDSRDSMQAVSMYSAFRGTRLCADGINCIADFSTRRLCGRDRSHRYFVCSAGIITKMDISSRPDVGNVRISFLPHSLHFLSLEHCAQEYSVDTRMLPRESRVINLSENLIHGSFELRTLPPSLVFLSVHTNRLSGVLMLTNLPRMMEAIYAWGNQFSGKYAYCSNLPESLQIADVSNALLAKEPVLKSVYAEERIDYQKYGLGGW